MKSRLDHVIENIKWGYVCTVVTYFFGFIMRTAVIIILGENYAGIGGLFANILGVLSFAELGIGTAMNYSLYRPIASNNTEKIKSLMKFYKKAYSTVAFVIAVSGLMLLPFLKYLVNDPGEVGDIRLYYVIYLFTTVTSYFVSYKYSYVNAKQDNYVVSIVGMVSSSLTYIFQIFVLILTKQFFLYLVFGAIVDLIQKGWISCYLNKRYPILCEKNAKKLEKKELMIIKDNTKALVIHKVGDVCVHQTDNIIISSFINLVTVGRVTYYSYFISAMHQVLCVALNSVVGTLGNAISEVSKEKQYSIFKIYRFAAFWIYGLTTVGLYFMISKIITFLVGDGVMLPRAVTGLMLIDYYMLGQRAALNNMKMAGGIFAQDQYISIVQAIVNLVMSVILVTRVGLIGVYIGTVTQGLIASLVRPIIVYPYLFKKSPLSYFKDSLIYACVVMCALSICTWIDAFFVNNNLWMIILEASVLFIVINAVFALALFKTREFRFVWNVYRRKK